MKQQAKIGRDVFDHGRARWAMPHDLNSIHSINVTSIRHSWSAMQSLAITRDSSLICRVIDGPAFVGSRVVGYVCYAIRPDHVEILNLAVRHEYRRSGVGRALLSTAVAAMWRSPARRFVLLDVAERNTPAAVWARSCGLYCGGVVHLGPDDVAPDATPVVDIDPDGIETGFYRFSMTREAVPAAMQRGLIV